MTDQSSSPALLDDELRETLNMVGTVVASVSDRMDAQTQTMDRLVKTATEARQAAFAAQSQTDPKLYSDIIAKTVQNKTQSAFDRIVKAGILLTSETEKTADVLDQVKKDKWDVINDIRAREAKVERTKSRLQWFGLGVVVLALGMTVMLPRFLVSNSSGCSIIGGEWTSTTTGVDACVFYDQ